MILHHPTKTLTSAYTTVDADIGYRLICNSASPFTITLHSPTGRFNYDLEIDNIGSGAVTVGGQAVAQYGHAHVGCDGTSWVVTSSSGSTYTDEQAQAAVGNILTDSADVDFVYNDSANTITASLKATGVTAGNYTSANITVDVNGRIVTASSGLSTYYEPLTNGNMATPEILFYNGDIIMSEVKYG